MCDIDQKQNVVCMEGVKVNSLLYVYQTNYSSNVAWYAGSGVYLRKKESLSSCNMKEKRFNSVTLSNKSVANNMAWWNSNP